MERSNRWKMNRAGLLNFWYYDEETFDFSDGKLLLRGSNGSGKSVTMQSFLPVLLDGKKSPDRLDPFGSKARKMEDYLLGEKDVVNRDERTGYLFLEYKKENSNQYMTTGIGLQAKRHKDMKFWGFVITDNRRIGKDFQLYQMSQSEKIPLSTKELENRIGEGGQVVRGQREYMNLVNKHIFGFQTLDAFDELIKLLIQLRSPKLSKDFRPTVIYEILESALPPLGDDDLRHLSDTIENMDQARQQLEQLDREHLSAKKLVDVYDQYNRYILAEKADYVRKTESSFLSSDKKKQELEKLIVELSREIEQLKSNQEDLNRRKVVAENEKESLNRHEVWRLQKEINSLKETLISLKADLERKNNQLDAKKKQELEQRNKLEEIRLTVFELEKDEEELMDEMDLDAREAAFAQHVINVEDMKRSQSHTFDFTVWEQETEAYKLLLEDIKNDLNKQEQLRSDYESKSREASEIKQAIDRLRNEQDDLEKLYEEDRQKLEERIFQWMDEKVELEIPSQTKQEISRAIYSLYDESDYEQVKQPVIDAIFSYQEILGQKSSKVKHALELKNVEKAEYEAERVRWKNMNDPEPDRATATNTFREQLAQDGKAFVPFYAAVEFQEHLSDEQKERMEAALKQAGILDSLIIENPINLQADRYIRPNPSMFGHTLADYLQPDIDGDHPVSKQLIDDVLRTILIGEDESVDTSGNIHIDEEGFYRIGDLFGHAPQEDTARFIGRTSRKRFQKEKVAQYDALILAVTAEILALKHEVNELEYALQKAKELKDSFPTDGELREIFKQLQRYKVEIDTKQEAFNRVDAQYKETARLYHAMKLTIQEKSKHIDLKQDLPAYEAALTFMKTYQSHLNKLEKIKIRLVGYLNEISSLKNRIEELVEEILEIAGERNEIESNIKKGEAEFTAKQNQLNMQGIQEVQQRIQNVLNELKEIDLNLDAVKGELPAKKEQLIQQQKDLNKLQREAAFWKDLLRSWQRALDVEHSHQFVELEETNAKAVFENYQGELKKYDRSKMNDLLTRVYYNEQPQLMEYRLTESDQALDIPEELQYEDLDANEQLQIQQWKQVNRRKMITMEYQGQKVSPYFVLASLVKELESQQQWLDEQDRQLYEDIILNTVGSILRSRINRAEKWIKQMDKLMGERNSSSGLTFSISWKPKTAEMEEEMDTKELVELLQMNSKFLKEEDLNKITRHFQSKISKAKELIELRNEGNTLHQVLKEVLDYRKWFSFILSYRREGEPKRELTNNAFYKFSGGEKAMAMYIPLFTAAYSRYQEASPSAPYIVSLDEAFAGVDENNIRDMFQVVEELGFNYIMNSQALWGDYDTVSGLSICELVRPKNADFVTVIRYKWDGKTKYLDLGEPELEESLRG